MAGYILKIENSEVEDIELSTMNNEMGEDNSRNIEKLLFKMNTLDDSVRNHSDNARIEITIEGIISETNKDKLKQFAKWSMDFNKKSMYRNVTLEVYSSSDNDSGEVLRRYEIEYMFVIDYEENFGEQSSESNSSDAGKYKLFLAQKEGNYKKDIFSN